jgi:dUTP pyrophosphatase
MLVKVKKTNERAEIPFKTYDEDFCYDCVATSCEEIAPNVYKYGLGLAFEICRSAKEPMIIREEMCSTAVDLLNSFIIFDLDFRPRSSVWKTGMVLSNCTGTVDELYRGEVSAVFYHVLPNMPKYEVGDKIIQCKLGATLPIKFCEVENLSNTARGDGGYGSTGQ